MPEVPKIKSSVSVSKRIIQKKEEKVQRFLGEEFGVKRPPHPGPLPSAA
jgi:hypothetical protein